MQHAKSSRTQMHRCTDRSLKKKTSCPSSCIIKTQTTINSQAIIMSDAWSLMSQAPVIAIEGPQVGAGPSGYCEGEAIVQQVVLQGCSVGQWECYLLQMCYEGRWVVLSLPAACAHFPWQRVQHPHLNHDHAPLSILALHSQSVPRLCILCLNKQSRNSMPQVGRNCQH